MRALYFHLIVAAVFVAPSSAANGAHVQLRPECRCRGPIVRLGDVADVFADDAVLVERLKQIELFPAPLAGKSRTVRIREIQDVLVLRSVNLASCQFSGSSEITIYAEADGVVASRQLRPLSSSALRNVEHRVTQAIVYYLQTGVDARAAWNVTVELDQQQAASFSTLGQQLVAGGGRPPWVGAQDFVVSASMSQDAATVSVTAHVTLPAMVVVAVRSLRSREKIREADVRLGPAPANSQARELVHRIEDVVGKETTRSVSAGLPIDERYIRPPILVRRNQVVTVYARAAGVQVKTHARALEDGSRGDLITVQTLQSREKYSARVADIQEVEVYAGATRVSEPAVRQGSLGANRPTRTPMATPSTARPLALRELRGARSFDRALPNKPTAAGSDTSRHGWNRPTSYERRNRPTEGART